MSEHFKILYATYYKKVYRTCHMILKNHQMAEDVTHDTFMMAFEQSHTLKDYTKFPAWITAIAANKAKTYYNRNKKVISLDEEATLDYVEQNNATQIDLSATLAKGELREDLREAIKQLKPEFREIVILKYYHGLQEQEISEMLSLPIGTIKSSLHRAKKILATKLPFTDMIISI